MKKNINALFTSNSDNWKTPKTLYDYFINNNYFDPCPYNFNINGLEIYWERKTFINPPFSLIKEFVNKALERANNLNNKIILLIPSRTDTKYFQSLLNYKNSYFYFIKGRLKFNDSKNSAPFPSCIIFLNFNDYEILDIINDLYKLNYIGELMERR